MRTIVLACLLLAACGNGAEPAIPPGVSTASAAAASRPAPSSLASTPDLDVAGENPAKPRSRKPFEIHSSCPGIVTVIFGDDPKDDSAGRRTLAPNSAIDGPRGADGKQTVTVQNEKGDRIGTVHITKGMKRLEVGRSCQTVNAD